MLLILILALSQAAYAGRSTYDKLAEVNKCWTVQQKLPQLPSYRELSEHEWIRLHLSLVEQTLRHRDTRSLSRTQRQNRAYCLDRLQEYWKAGHFPINEDYNYRTPIFIDNHDNFCAVGFLLKTTGYERVSRMIAANTKLAYVQEMAYPELNTWASDYGFSVDELAWIQPGYPPESVSAPVGNGVSGHVQELFVDATADKLYVAGDFDQVDKTIFTSNIAYVTGTADAYTWHRMGSGVNGPVSAITRFEGKIFVGGSFNKAGGKPAENIACWDGSAWQSAGCLDGRVKDLVVYEGKLYAAGNFNSCSAGPGKNFAYWDGSTWTTIEGLSGQVNTMKVSGGFIILGGAFGYDGAEKVNLIKWSPGTSFQTYTATTVNEVKDLDLYNDTLHASCSITAPVTDSNLLIRLEGSKWAPAIEGSLLAGFFQRSDLPSFSTICVNGTELNTGGDFYFSPDIGTVAANCFNFTRHGRWINLDGPVHKMVVFKGELIIGGEFKKGNCCKPEIPGSIEVNGIARRILNPTSIREQESGQKTLSIFPNPVKPGNTLSLTNDFGASSYMLSTITGSICAAGPLDHKSALQMPQLAAGIYLITLSNKEGQRAVQKVVVE